MNISKKVLKVLALVAAIMMTGMAIGCTPSHTRDLGEEIGRNFGEAGEEFGREIGKIGEEIGKELGELGEDIGKDVEKEFDWEFDSPKLNIGRLKTEYHDIELGEAQSADVKIKMGAGQLKVKGDADKLLEGEFAYNIESWKPIVDYSIIGKKGRLYIEQPSKLRVPLGKNMRYEWDLRFLNEIPMDMEIVLGAGVSTLELGDLSLNDLDIKMGAGEMRLDLVGNWKDDLDVTIEGGVGKAHILLPEDVGVRVDVEGGLGSIKAYGMRKDGNSYINDAYRSSDVTMRVDVEAGIGEIVLEVMD